MSTQPPQIETQLQRQADFEKFKNYTAYTFLIASPLLIALPPRKLDHLTVLLVGAFAFSANHVTREHTGRSIVERMEARIARPRILNELPSERAQEVQMRLRAAREAQLREGGMPADELEKWKALQKQQEQGLAQRVWLGGEKEGWLERRRQEEQKALEEGKGYGDLISEYVWDVWSWGKKQEEEEDDD
ncbi:hypothetical protein N7520_006104 [Penicillium odoratum]|uniref:uncharacterized protein n=1 Tax=Penicillium odoratum TaxID=1167516 RepID=UPI002548A250|nr:uncharacterized protein N7520_006104 [Penicillium odoratum]KAJ5758948.1 hypothetical protein N7520_006104 [Penicillium odoratum]